VESIEQIRAQTWEGFRLSPQQERLWRLLPALHSQRTVCLARIQGPIRRETLNATLTAMVNRHEILRTSIRPILGHESPALQVIQDARWSDTTLLETVSLHCTDDRESFQSFLREERGLPADRHLHVTLCPHGPDMHKLIINAPRYCIDGGSMRWLLQELVYSYASNMGLGSEAPELKIQYADFAQWQADLSELDDSEAAVEYWLRPECWTGPPMQLPLELTATSGDTELTQWNVDPQQTAALARLTTRYDVDFYTFLLACWCAVLWRVVERRPRIVVDTLFNGRPSDRLGSALGCYESYGPIELTLSGEMTFGELIRLVGTTLERGTALQTFLPTALSRIPCSRMDRVGFSHYEWPKSMDGAELILDGFDVQCQGEPFKLELVTQRAPDRLVIGIRYKPKSFGAAAVGGLIDALRAFLINVAFAPERTLDSFPLLTPDAGQKLVAEYNPPTMADLPQRLFHEEFSKRAAAIPDAVALVYYDRTVTYGELDRQSNRMARALQQRGIRPGSIVGLSIDRSDSAVMALLGILKAGCAYLPIDVRLPRIRRELVLLESGASLLVTEMALQIDSIPGIPILNIDGGNEIELESADYVDGGSAPDDLAYVIYTSGSSGTPKGIAIAHRHLMCYTESAIERLALFGMSSFATLTTLASDLGNTAIFPALCLGAKLSIIPREIASDAEALAAHFAEHPCDVLKCTPSHISMLIAEAPNPARLLPLQRLVLGGEALGWGTLRMLQGLAPRCRIFNHYGPAECCIGVLAGEPNPANAQIASTVPLGWPLKRARVYILDSQLRPLSYGAIGELCVGGDTVGRGYQCRPDLTAERFVSDAFSDQPGARLYRTGDLARYLPDGSIEFMGRLDRQLKIRGFRVEPAEIESVLRQHPDVIHSVVVPHGESGDQKLVAYISTKMGSMGRADWLRSFVRDRLPDFMIPDEFIALKRFPLTTNGKIDCASLPDPDSIAAPLRNSASLPRTNTERTVASIFAELLGLDTVYVEDDFFDIGGHSLLATRLLSRLRSTFSVDLGLRRVFENSTVGALSAALDERRSNS
jgi:amino acid adenylation domain-containing protein